MELLLVTDVRIPFASVPAAAAALSVFTDNFLLRSPAPPRPLLLLAKNALFLRRT